MHNRVNLLPWRARRIRRRRKQALSLSTLILITGLAAGCGWCYSLHKDWRMLARSNQRERFQLEKITRQLNLRQPQIQQLKAQTEREEINRRRLSYINRLSRMLNQIVALLPPQVWLTRISATEEGVRCEGKALIQGQLKLWVARIQKAEAIDPILTSISDDLQGGSVFTLELQEKQNAS